MDASPWTLGVVAVGLAWLSWLIVLVTRAVENVKLQQYAIRARIAARARAGKTKKASRDYDEDDVPPWLDGMARAAGVDLEKLADEDPGELQKVQQLIQRRLQVAGAPANGGGWI